MDMEAIDDTNSGILDLAVSVSVKIPQSTYFLVRTLVFESIRPCHKVAIFPRGNKKALFYHAKPHPHGFHCEAWRGKTKLFWSPGAIWPPCDKGEYMRLLLSKEFDMKRSFSLTYNIYLLLTRV